MESKKVLQNMQRLLAVLDEQNQVTTEEAMRLLDASEATVRRLFTRLAEHGKALRTFGGVSRLVERESYWYDELVQLNENAKQAIALQAVEYVSDGDVLYLDGGTTLLRFAQELNRRALQGDFRRLSVFTNSLSTLNALQGMSDLTLLGGRFRANRQDFYGCLVEDALSKLRFSKCFLGTDAVEGVRGFTTTELETARLNEAVLKASKLSFVLADASKFGATSLVSFAAPGEVTSVIVDFSLDSEDRERFLAQGIHFAQ